MWKRGFMLSGLLVLLICAIGVISSVSAGPTRSQPEAANPAAVANMIRYEVQGMTYWLRLAAGEDVACGNPCVRDTSFANIINGLILRCDKVEPASLRGAATYDEAQDGQALSALAGACSALRAARDTLGEPSQNGVWMQKAVEIKSILTK